MLTYTNPVVIPSQQVPAAVPVVYQKPALVHPHHHQRRRSGWWKVAVAVAVVVVILIVIVAVVVALLQKKDPCSKNNGMCEGGCVNEGHSYQCTCAPGFALAPNGHNCIDIDECMVSNGWCHGICTNTYGSYECSCEKGSVLGTDQRTCQDARECSYHNGGCEHICVDTLGSHYCKCREGYSLNINNKLCDDINECAAGYHGCGDLACENQIGSYTCGCADDQIDVYRDDTACAPHFSNCCSGVPCELTSDEGYLVSFGYPASYANSVKCEYVINVEGAQNGIQLRWLSFKTEEDYDIVSIYDGPDSDFPFLLEEGSGTNVPDVQSSGGFMFVNFTTDSSDTNIGFVAHYYKL